MSTHAGTQQSSGRFPDWLKYPALLLLAVFVVLIIGNVVNNIGANTKQEDGASVPSEAITWHLIGHTPDIAQMRLKGLDLRLEAKDGTLINIKMSCQNGTTRIDADIDSNPFNNMYDGVCNPSQFWHWWNENIAEIERILGPEKTAALKETLKIYIP